MWRSVGFHVRDYWSDLGNGLMITEEARDVPRGAAHARDVTPRADIVTGQADPLLAAGRDDPPAPDEVDAALAVYEDAVGVEVPLDVEVVDVELDGTMTHVASETMDIGFTFDDDVPEEVDPETGEVIPDGVGESTP